MAIEENKNILEISKSDQYRTVDDLLAKSQPNATYYSFLILSSFIIACGLLLNSPAIVIGGMLVTPVLVPVLAMALGITTGVVGLLKDTSILIFKSIVIIVFGALLTAFIFGSSQNAYTFENSVKTAILYFIVALVSGVAATFAWTRNEVSEVLPGVSIAVSLVPPLSLIGIALSRLDSEATRFFFLVFLFNFLGVLMGSMIVFSLLKFYRAQKKVHQENINSKTNGK